ncbi:B12-binding domain-containing radical SAM protein, partial [Thermodesulfobacteriota bacterium]
MLKICLYCARFSDQDILTAPLGVAYLAAYLMEQGIVSKENLIIADTIDEAIKFNPDIIGVSSLSHVLDDAIRFAGLCKEKTACLTVLGSYHISSLPSSLPEVFDIGVIGEGEITFTEIVTHFKKDLPVEGWCRDIKGTCYRSENKIRINEKRPLINDIDSLPYPYRHKTYTDDLPVFTSRGCPFRCTFCASHKFWQDKIRFRSHDSVINEICEAVDKYKPKEVVILDDLWMANKDRFNSIANGLIENNIPRKITFRGFCRSNLIHEDEIIQLKRLNYRVVRFGAETGSDRLLKKIKGKNIS